MLSDVLLLEDSPLGTLVLRQEEGRASRRDTARKLSGQRLERIGSGHGTGANALFLELGMEDGAAQGARTDAN